ncbi:MAG: hypothetical protein U9R08_06785 [Nanoarchaeota archaeon]|nr:hypothetical protein [Nanoarchaeota archaeon]
MAVTALGLLYVVIGIIVSAIFLWLFASYVYKCKEKNFITAFLIAAIIGIVTYVLGLFRAEFMIWVNLAVTVFLGIFLIKKWYNLKLQKTLLIWLTWFIVMVVISYLLNLLTPISFATGVIG